MTKNVFKMESKDNLLVREHNLRPHYVHPKILESVSEYYLPELSTIIVEYVSPALCPSDAIDVLKHKIKPVIERYWRNIGDNDGNPVLEDLVIIVGYMVGVACTNPAKIICPWN